MTSSWPARPDTWPKGLYNNVVKLLSLYFHLVDSKEASAGPRLADEVFSKDGKWFASAGYFEGHDGIAASRIKAWDTVNSQSHELRKVFLNDAHGLDLLLVGVANVDRKNTGPITVEFFVRAVISNELWGPRVKYWQPVALKPVPSDQPLLADVEL
ncbi:uncharacterized protein A1O5_08554 [Cladophialophora psammophila CBS 110553]|uniref:SnoaL-like domain-containing protein n=1 Tax=Cladophialophora psammophila CBS 110553 TaxID=1182543 RepID=W9WSG4_9EURO|nr:uncharacterized protein A1O5_08554 [Cladophialophora psammophila CBS 110553]EXJ67940.1 hypothetical protein A1O5_08554 [Cladophialophora psammophila CBS 110553]